MLLMLVHCIYNCHSPSSLILEGCGGKHPTVYPHATMYYLLSPHESCWYACSYTHSSYYAINAYSYLDIYSYAAVLCRLLAMLFITITNYCYVMAIGWMP